MSRKKLCIYLSLVITIATILPAKSTLAAANVATGTVNELTNTELEQGVSPSPSPVTPEPPTISPTVAPENPTTTPENPTLPPTDPSATITPSPAVTEMPTTPTPSTEPTRLPYRSKTLERMSTYDYIGKSVTGISSAKETLANLQKKVKSIGRLYGTGMPYDDYQEAMDYQWEDITEYDMKPSKINVDITKTMNYNTYVSTLKNLSRYPGVYLYKIGKSMEGRELYAIEIDIESNEKKNVIMMTGQIHAREFAGGTYIVKEFVDLVQKAQTDPKTMELLKKNKFVAVPIINVDGREAIIESSSKWSTRSGELWKAYTNGTDGGRNFPGLQWGQVLKGNSYKSMIATKPSYANYPGSYAGSTKETKAMIKWLYHYTVVEKAALYLDLHQQGSIIYAGKTWQTSKQSRRSTDLRTGVLNVINKGITRRKYSRVYEGSLYGMRGEGSSLTDYAITLAIGAKFSPAYGFSAFTDGKQEYILLQIKDLDTSKIKFKESNPNFAAITMEIGYGRKYLGNSPETRRLLANEYNYYNYGKLLENLPSMIKR